MNEPVRSGGGGLVAQEQGPDDPKTNGVATLGRRQFLRRGAIATLMGLALCFFPGAIQCG